MGKSSKSLLSFFNKDIEVSKQGFIKQKSILLFFNKDIEFSKQTKFYLNNKRVVHVRSGGSLRVHSNVLILVSSLAIVLARF